MPLETVSKEEVLWIYQRLVEDFASTDDPIAPPGVKSELLLDSAIDRQHVGLAGVLKYPDPVANAATLTYGICLNHAFHNGNKRTALVAMLAHLDKNRLVLDNIPHAELFGMVIALASHTFGTDSSPVRAGKRRKFIRHSADTEVGHLSDWLRKRTKRVVRGERLISFRELRRILNRFNYVLDNPKGNSIDILRVEVAERGIPFFKKKVEVRKHVGNIGYPGDNKIIPTGTLKHLRKICRLTEEDGVDSRAFYDQEAVVDGFIKEYRTILRKLARR